MAQPKPVSRRTLLQRLLLLAPAVSVILVRAARAAALLSPQDPQAQALRYTEDARSEPAAKDNRCANCALYQGAEGSTQGPCQLFAGKEVKAAGWCSSWAPQL